MPNSFLGFPVRRAMLADYALKTETMQNAFDTKDLFLSGFFESIDGYTIDHSTDGTVTLFENEVLLKTSATMDNYAQLSKSILNLYPEATWADEVRLLIKARLQKSGGPNGEAWITVGTRLSSRHVGFYLEDGKLYGSVGNGSVQTKTAALADWSAGAFSQVHTFLFTMKTGVATFYMDGVELATLSSGLPTGTTGADTILFLYASNTDIAQAFELGASYYKLFREVPVT